MKKEKMTIDQHIELGREIKNFRACILQSHVMRVGGKTSREYKAVRKALDAVDELRNQLDNVVCRDYMDFKDATKIYYGHEIYQANAKIVHPATTNPNNPTPQENV
jgi:hypothetical protein